MAPGPELTATDNKDSEPHCYITMNMAILVCFESTPDICPEI